MSNLEITSYSMVKNWKKTKNSYIKNSTNTSTLIIFIQYNFQCPSHNIWRRRKKRIYIGKEEGKKQWFFADGVVLYIENSKKTTRKLLEIINEVCIIVRYKINTQKSLAFLYTKNEKLEREVKETVPFTIKKNKTPRKKPT